MAEKSVANIDDIMYGLVGYHGVYKCRTALIRAEKKHQALSLLRRSPQNDLVSREKGPRNGGGRR